MRRPTLLAASQNTIDKELARDLARTQALLVKSANFRDDLLLLEIFDQLSADPAPAVRRWTVRLVSLFIEAEVSQFLAQVRPRMAGYFGDLAEGKTAIFGKMPQKALVFAGWKKRIFNNVEDLAGFVYSGGT